MNASITSPSERYVQLAAGSARLPGSLAVPAHPCGLVLFAHGSGSGWRSPRNTSVAETLRSAGLATLQFNLLTEQESARQGATFDVRLLAQRLLAATDWAGAEAELAGLSIGYFGASTGAAAALVAAATSRTPIGAVVSRGGRPDLAGDHLPQVKAPTLLLVGSRDTTVLTLNRQAFDQLTCVKRLVVIPGASHLFEEPGTLEDVARWAAEWFVHHLAMARTWRPPGGCG